MPIPFRPTIKPWLPRMWRDPDTLQIGLDPDAGTLLSGLDLATARWLTGLDGSRSEPEILSDAASAGLDLGSAVRVLSGLSRAGVLLPGPIDSDDLGDRGQLLPELVALTGSVDPSASDPAAARRRLADRGEKHVAIHGANRVGVPLAALLAASGIGRLSFLDSESARRCDASVGGLSPDDEGETRSIAAARAIRRISAVPDQSEPGATRRPDLVILCQPWAAHDPLQAGGWIDPCAHLVVAVREGTVVIGPLVLPGRTSCLRCAERHRTDRDLRWPAVARQLLAAPRRAIHEPTSVVACLAAALAAGQVLQHFDGPQVADVIDATLELRPPDWQIHRRRWAPHDECGCLDVGTESARVG